MKYSELKKGERYYITTKKDNNYPYWSNTQHKCMLIKKHTDYLIVRLVDTKGLVYLKRDELTGACDLDDYLKCTRNKQLYDRSLVCEP